jgi:uncharacterized membrane protein YoaK (UPF0700 family)
MLLLLAIAGGAVDAAILLGFGVLTAAQTGNTILLAVAVARGQLTTGMHAIVSMLGYVTGTAVGEVILDERGDAASRTDPVWRALLAELAALVALLVAWQAVGRTPAAAPRAALVMCAAVAMGIQSAAVLRLHAGPTTTYVTGTLTTFTAGMIRRLRRSAPATRPAASDRPWLYGVTWLAYVSGALVGAHLARRVGAATLALPIVAIGGAGIVDVRRRRAAR